MNKRGNNPKMIRIEARLSALVKREGEGDKNFRKHLLIPRCALDDAVDPAVLLETRFKILARAIWIDLCRELGYLPEPKDEDTLSEEGEGTP